MEDLVQALAKFEQSLRSELKAGFDEVRGRFDEVFGHFDAIYHRFDKLETEYHMLVVGVKRIEERRLDD